LGKSLNYFVQFPHLSYEVTVVTPLGILRIKLSKGFAWCLSHSKLSTLVVIIVILVCIIFSFLGFSFLIEILQEIWDTSLICTSSLRRGHANLLCIVPILVHVLPKQALYYFLKMISGSGVTGSKPINIYVFEYILPTYILKGVH